MAKQLSAEELKELKSKMRSLLAVNRQKLLLKYPFTGGVLMRMDLVPVRDMRVRTACTDGTNIYCDIAFWSGLTPDEQEFVLAHETWHCILMHFARLQNREQEIFNIATDMEVNNLLSQDKLKMPEDGVVQPPELRGKSAEECYEWLLQQQKKGGRKQMMKAAGLSGKSNEGSSGGSDGSDDSDDGDGSSESQSKKSHKQLSGQFDKHLHKEHVSEESKDPRKKQQDGNGQDDQDDQDGDNKSGGKKKQKKSGSSGNGNGEGEWPIKDKYGDVGFDPDYQPGISESTVEKVREAAISAAQQCERIQGHLPSHISQIVDNLKKPEIRWQEVLSQFVTSCYNGSRRWLPPSRRHVYNGLYLQSRRQERINVTVAIDTSGSCTGDIPKFMSELVSLLKTFGGYELHLIQCDAEVSDYKEYDDTNPFPIDDVKSFKWKGFGGTSFCPPFDYVKQHGIVSDCFIYMTDSFGDAPENPPPYPVLWILTADGNENFCKWGQKLRFKPSKGRDDEY